MGDGHGETSYVDLGSEGKSMLASYDKERTKKAVDDLIGSFNRDPGETVIEAPIFNAAIVTSPMSCVDELIRDIGGSLDKREPTKEILEYRKKFGELIKDKIFFDLGCGNDEKLTMDLARILSKYGAKEYVGVDLNPEKENYEVVRKSEGGEMKAYIVKGDMFELVHKVPDNYGGNFLLSGLEYVDPEGFTKEKDEEYLKKFIKNFFQQLHRIMNTGDVIMISGPSFGIIKGKALHERYSKFSPRQQYIVDGKGNKLFELMTIPGSPKYTDNAIYKKI